MWFGKSKLSVVERYINKLMRTGAYTGKKQSAMKAFESALDILAERRGMNPLQVFVDAICNAAPMEEITRIKFGAVSQPKAVDSSPSRRLDVALKNLAKGAQQGTHSQRERSNNASLMNSTKPLKETQHPLPWPRKKKLNESLHLLDETAYGEEFRQTFASCLRTPFKWAN